MKIGTDIVQISRIENSLDRFGMRFKERFLTPQEIDRVATVESIAGVWASKEAISKALGCGIGRDLAFCDIIIYKDSRGAPYFELTPKARLKYPIRQSSLSISHDGGFAIAVVALTISKGVI
jgi:holo-[acyl-carrier protein] synthase